MVLHASIHNKDAGCQMQNATHEEWNNYLLKNSKKWDIQKTLIHVLSNGIKQNFYLDSKGKYVYASAHYIGDNYVIIGEQTQTSELPEIKY